MALLGKKKQRIIVLPSVVLQSILEKLLNERQT